MTLKHGVVDGKFLVRLSGNIEGLGNLRRLARHLCRQIEIRPVPVQLDISKVRHADEHFAGFVAFLEEWTRLEPGREFGLVEVPAGASA